MPLSDKTRKALWGRSGNRCAICKHELVIDATDQDDESVVGDECHIVSAREKGPRHDPSYPKDNLDSYENLILLCRTHHKMVDDQQDTYTVDILRQMELNHEAWVSQKLTDKQKPKPLRLLRVKKNIPPFLFRLTTGKQALDLVMGSYAHLMDHDELKSPEEVNLVGGFLQAVSDWSLIGDDLEPNDRVSAAYSLTQSLHELEGAGFFVFGGREVQLLEGGVQDEPSDWPVAILMVLRKENEGIIYANLDDLTREIAPPVASSGGPSAVEPRLDRQDLGFGTQQPRRDAEHRRFE